MNFKILFLILLALIVFEHKEKNKLTRKNCQNETHKIKSIKKTFFNIVYSKNNKPAEIRSIPSSIDEHKDLGITYFDKKGRKIKYEKQLKNDSILNKRIWEYNDNDSLAIEIDYSSFGKHVYHYNDKGYLIKKLTLDKQDSIKYISEIQYKDTLKISQKTFSNTGKHVFSERWKYNSNGILKSRNQSFYTFFRPNDERFYSYDSKNNKIELFKKDENGKKIILIKYKYNANNKLTQYITYLGNKIDSKTEYSYDLHGEFKSIKYAKYYNTFKHIKRTEILRNNNRDIIQRITYNLKVGTNINNEDKFIETYKYTYDEFQNWTEREYYISSTKNDGIRENETLVFKENNGSLKSKTYRIIQYY